MNRSKADKTKYFTIALILILVLQSINILFWGAHKEGYFGDELYSFHFVCEPDYPSMNADREDSPYYETWKDASYYGNYFTLDSSERFRLDKVWKSIEQDVHPPIYYLMLHLSCSIASFWSDTFTPWPGIALNLIFFLINQFLLYRLSRRIFGKEHPVLCLLPCVLYGFSIGAVTTAVLIRMYMVLTSACLLYLITLFDTWKVIENGAPIRKRVLSYGKLVLSFWFGFLTQYYFLIFLFFASLFFLFWLILRRKFDVLLEVVLSFIAALWGSSKIWPAMHNQIFGGYHGSWAVEKLHTISSWGESFRQFTAFLNEYIFSGYGKYLLVLFVVIFIIMECRTGLSILEKGTLSSGEGLRIRIVKKRPAKNSEDRKAGMLFTYKRLYCITICIAFLGFFLMITKIAPFLVDRYIMNLYPILFLLLVVAGEWLLRRWKLGKRTAIVLILCSLILLPIGYHSVGVGYLYQGNMQNLSTIKQYADDPVILITEGSRYDLTCNSYYLLDSEKVYSGTAEDIGKLPELINESGIGTGSSGSCILFLLDDDQTDTHLTEACDSLGVTEQPEYLFTTEVSKVYRIDW